MNPIFKSIDLGNGKTITLETGRLAKQADGSVVVR
jgi:polyribonucleotide nucleotidyltransferase